MIIPLVPTAFAARRAAPPVRILLIDNGDSLTAQLAAACRADGALVEQVDNNIDPDAALACALDQRALIMLSPGPSGPAEAGCCMELIARAAALVPVIGICLGHQAIVAHHGGRVVPSHEPSHGKSSAIDHDGAGPFSGLPSPMRVGRYHNLCTPLNDVPDALRVHAALDGMAMAVGHAGLGQFGLQFHPESVLTPLGARLLSAILAWGEERRGAFARLTGADPAGKVAA